MKMLKREDLESPEQQERRARQALNANALLKSALLAMVIVFVFPAAGPWMSQGAFLTVFGRIIAEVAVLNLVFHCLLSLLYGWVIGLCIYRLPTSGGILVGTALFLPLFGINYVIFRLLGGVEANEFHVGLAHLTFCLIFSVAYKAMAVPRQRRTDGRPAIEEAK